MPRHPAPAFTRQHFVAIAEIVSDFTQRGPDGDWIDANALVESFVELFDDSNARFDAQRFRAACAPPTKEDNA